MGKLRRRRRMQLPFFGLVLVLAGAAAGQAQETQREEVNSKPPKPAWRWTLEERLAARFDPEGMKVRAAEDAVERKKAEEIFGERFDAAENQLSIVGHKEPELFLPSELFVHLMSLVYPEDGNDQAYHRGRLEEGAVILGFGKDLWERLEKAASPYLKVRNERYRRAMAAHARSENFEDTEADISSHCRARAKALEAAKAEFGEEAFLRLLYEVVAPSVSFGYSVEEGAIEQQRFREGGCQ